MAGQDEVMATAAAANVNNAVARAIRPPQPGPTLLPASLARGISFATQSASMAIRLGFLVTLYGLDAAKLTTVSSLELTRSLVEGVLGRAGREAMGRSRTSLGAVDAEVILERSLASLHHMVTQVVFWTTAGFHLTGTSLSAASEVSQLGLSFLDQLFGSTDTSRAIASIVTLVRREFDNPATGTTGEKVSVFDLVVALAAVAYLQRQCRRTDEEKQRRQAYEETIWDVVVLKDGQRVDIHEESLSGAHPGHYRSRYAGSGGGPAEEGSSLQPIGPQESNWQGLEEDDDATFSRIKNQIASALPPDATITISSTVSTVQTITVDMKGSQPLAIAPPPGAEIVEMGPSASSSGISPTDVVDAQPSYRVVYKIERNKLRSATLQHEEHGAEDAVVELPHNKSPELSMALVHADQPSSPDVPSRHTLPAPAANQKKQRSPPNLGAVGAGTPRQQEQPGKETAVADKETGPSSAGKTHEKKSGLKKVLRGSSQTLSSMWSKDSANETNKHALPKTTSTKRPAGPPNASGSPKRPGRSNHRQAAAATQASATLQQTLQAPNVRTRSSSRASYVSIHEHRRNSIVSQAESFMPDPAGGLRPASPSVVRREVAAEESVTRPRTDSNARSSLPPSPRKDHRRPASYGQSLYSLGVDESQTSLVLSSYHQKSVYSASDALNVLRREGIVSGTFPHAHLLDNVTRYMRFSSASYGSHFLKFLGMSKDLPLVKAQDDIHRDVRHFVHHTESVSDNVLLASFIDPQGGTDSSGQTGTGVPLVHYIALDHTQKAVVLVCRGTLGFEDVMADATCDYDVLTWRGRGYKVHKGIHASARRLLYGGDGRVLVTLREALEEFPDYGLVMCGHSLGGAVTSLLGIMLSEPNPNGIGFVTSAEPHNRLVANGQVVEGSVTDVRLPSGRRVHVYAYGPPGVMSRPLSMMTRGLITTVVHGHDVVPHLSLGLLHDLQAVALGFKKDENQAKADIRQQIWRALQENVKSRWHNHFFSSSSSSISSAEDDRLWMLPALDDLRATMRNEKLYPPGEVFVLESRRVLRRDAFLRTDEEHIGRPAERIVLKYIRDVEARFREVRFGASMMLDHSPARYEDMLNKLRLGVAD